MPKATAANNSVRVWSAHPRQALFLEAHEDEVLFGGAAGG